jgi:hypothetical protein
MPDFQWKKLSKKTKLSPHFTLGEWTKGVALGYLDDRGVSPMAPLAVVTFAELARMFFNRIKQPVDAEGFMVSSGVRTPNSNRGVKQSRHMAGRTYCAMDFRPQANWNGCTVEYDDFYGCFVMAQSHITEHFGLGYYSGSKAGIHVDCDFALRKRQFDTQILPWNKEYQEARGDAAGMVILRGYRWGPHGFSFKGNQIELTALHQKYHDPYANPRPWIEWAEELDVNLDLADIKDGHDGCCK